VEGNRRLLALLMLGVVAFGVYANTLTADFVFDDVKYIEPRDLSHIGELVNPLTKGGLGYRPLRNLSLAVDHALWGMKPQGFHVTNCILHVVATLLIFRICVLFLGSWMAGLLAALLFATHPIQTEAVAYISGRKDVLTTIFFVLGLLLFFQYRKNRRPLLFLPLIGVCYLFSLLSKEMGVTLPVIFFLWDLTLGRREGPSSRRALPIWLGRESFEVVRRDKILYIPFILGALFVALWFAWLVPSTRQGWWGGTPWLNLLTAARVHTHYLMLLLFPRTLVGDYSYEAFPITREILDVSSLTSLLIVGGLVLSLVLLIRRSPRISFLGLFYFVTLIPVSQIVPHHELLGERFLYLPSIAFATLTAWCLIGLAGVLARRVKMWPKERILLALAVPLLLVYTARSVVRNRDWRDDLTFWTRTTLDAPRCARAHRNLAYNLFYAGEPDRAIEHMLASLEIFPDAPDSHFNLGRMYEKTSQTGRAIYHYEKALRHPATRLDAHLNLGLLYARTGDFDQAEKLLTAALRFDDSCYEAHYNLGVLLRKEGREEEAMAHFLRAEGIKDSGS
jgi:Tfp pilus assembly protein PilF